MPRLFFGNYDFEHLLAGGNGRSLPASIRQINAELATCWMLIAQKNDILLLPEPVEKTFWNDMQTAGFPTVKPLLGGDQLPKSHSFTPWGWSQAMYDFAKSQHLVCSAPPVESVRQANSRRFSALLEDEFQVALPAARMITSLQDFSDAVQQLSKENHRWVVKHEFSNSARERIIGKGSNISEAEKNWMLKRWQKKSLLFFEPWVDAIEEVGIHFTVPVEGKPTLDGITPLLTDASGRYCGSRIIPNMIDVPPAQWQPAVAIGFKVATRLQEIGYFGPVGIDAMHYRLPDGSTALRPLQEINARWTMGRLALGTRKLLQPNEIGSWLHHTSLKMMSPLSESKNIRIIPTSPTRVNGKQVQHQTALCITNDAELLVNYEQRLYNSLS